MATTERETPRNSHLNDRSQEKGKKISSLTTVSRIHDTQQQPSNKGQKDKYISSFPNFSQLVPVFSTGQSVRPGAGRRWTAFSGPVRSFSKVALRPTAKDRFPAVPRETCFMPRKPSKLVSNLASGARLLMSSQLSSVPGGREYFYSRNPSASTRV